MIGTGGHRTQQTACGLVTPNPQPAFRSSQMRPLTHGERLSPGLAARQGILALGHQRGDDLPVIFVTGHGDIPMSVRAMKSGAVDFLSKPFRDQDVLDAVCSALNTARQRLAETRTTNIVRERFATLTARERQVMAGVVRGLLNKQIAYELGLSEITVKLHRSSLMKKMMVRSVPDLVRAEQLVAE